MAYLSRAGSEFELPSKGSKIRNASHLPYSGQEGLKVLSLCPPQGVNQGSNEEECRFL
jgi:hypothetical protein